MADTVATTDEAPVEISENDQKRADLAAKREFLTNLRNEREKLQDQAVAAVEAIALDRESAALDAEIQYEVDAARILLEAQDKEAGTDTKHEVEDGVYAGEAYVDESEPLAVVDEDAPVGEVHLPEEIELPSGYSPADLEPPTPAVESDTSLYTGVEVNTGPDTE